MRYFNESKTDEKMGFFADRVVWIQLESIKGSFTFLIPRVVVHSIPGSESSARHLIIMVVLELFSLINISERQAK